MRATTKVGGLCVGLILISGCRGILGVDGYGYLPEPTQHDAAPPGYIGKNDGAAYASKTCRDCVDQHCGSQADTCSREPGCAAMAKCLAKCDGPDNYKCRGQCNLGIQRTPEFADVVACEAESCPACPASRVVRGGEACDGCLATHCPDQVDELSKNPRALHFDTCQKDCSAPPTTPSEDGGVGGADCSCDASGDVTPLEDVNGCAAGPCNDACNPAVDWTCLGHVDWEPPAPPPNELTLHLYVINAANSLSPLLPVFEVSACSSIAFECDAPLTMTNGTNSQATLPINEANGRFFDYLLVTSADPPVDALVYFFPPIRRSPAWSTRRIVTRTFATDKLSTLGLKPDWDNKGGIVWSVTSCLGAPTLAKGVTVSVSPENAPDAGSPEVYYLSENGATLELSGKTSALGLGASVNVDEGAWTLKATTVVNGNIWTVGSYAGVEVFKGKITHLTLAPAPNGRGK